MMKKLLTPKMTLLSRIVLTFLAFCVSLLLQMGISRFQSQNVFAPMESRTQNIQEISQFLANIQEGMDALENYRWDYGDTGSLVALLQVKKSASKVHLENINADINEVSEEQYLLANAVKTTYLSYRVSTNELVEALVAGDNSAASSLYYESVGPCSGYLCLYAQQLLEQAILDNQDAFTELTSLNQTVNNALVFLAVLSFALGAAVMVSLFSLLRSVAQMAYASQEISQGNFDTPDLLENRQDEIGQMAIAFNEMKRSTKNQMKLLNEKNEIERKLHKKETEALELQNLMEREKLQQLRSQINPHFLFNTLNVIIYTAQQEKAARTQGLLGSLNQLLRYSIGSNETEVPLSKEVKIVNEYYSLLHARFSDRIRLSWVISPDVILTDMMVPSFILQPLVENAFKHGLSPKEEGGTVRISMEIQGTMLFICVEDDGVGMSREALEALRGSLEHPSSAGEHIGIYNVAARLRLLGDEYGLDIASEAGHGTVAALRLPVIIIGEGEDEQGD